MRALVSVIATVFAVGLLAPPAHLQEKGGEDETGPYDVVPAWPQEWASDGYIWGSQPGIFAESPDRIFVVERGELKKPDRLPRGWNGSWGSTGERAATPEPEMRNCILVLDGSGKVVERWTQWDSLFAGTSGPHKVKISPYDPERHVWVVNDSRQQIYEFTNDGRRLVMTLGEKDVAGDDATHFGRPQDLAWLPDGSILVADGLTNARIVKFDENGKFLMQWGEHGSQPGQLSGVHGIDADRNGHVYVADRSNQRVQVFDQNGELLDVWPDIRFPNSIMVAPDGNVWVADGDDARLLKYDPTGRLLVLVGDLRSLPGRLLGIAPVLGGLRRQLLRGRQLRGTGPEVPAEARRGQVEARAAARATHVGGG